MLSPSISRHISIAIATPVILLVITAGALTFSVHRIAVAAQWVEHSNQVVEKAIEARQSIINQETGILGYLTFHDPVALEPLRLSDPIARLEELSALIADNAVQKHRIQSLGEQYKIWRLVSEEWIQTPPDSSDLRHAFMNHKLKMDRIQSAFNVIINAEMALRETRLSAASDAGSLVFIGAFPLMLLLAATLALVSNGQVRAVGKAFEDVIEQERQASSTVALQAWVRVQFARVSQELLGDLSVHDICDRFTRLIAQIVEARIGLFYLVDAQGFELCGKFGAPPSVAEKLPRSNGLLEDAIAKNELSHVRNVPKGYLRVVSSTGDHDSEELVFLPIYSEGQILGVLELGFFSAIPNRSLELLARLGETVGSALHSAAQKRRLRHLLEETQSQAVALQHKQNELAASNEELEQQTAALGEANAHLVERKEALEIANAHLERQKVDLISLSTELRRKASELARTGQYKSDFLANMSHELRTPLNSQLILARLLAENKKGNLDAEQVKFAETIHGAGVDLLGLINNILDLSKVESGKIDIELTQISLSSLVNKTMSLFEPLAREKGIALIHTGNVEGSFESDVQRIEQVLRNLLANAIKFTASGQVLLHVTLEDAGVQFAVCDTGIGIASENLEVIFEAFRQADGTTSRHFGGTGLGLSIARELARLLGGDIAVESTIGIGSKFTLTIPRLPGPAVRAKSHPPVVSTAAPQSYFAVDTLQGPDLAKRDQMPEMERVLIVEDDAKFAQVLADVVTEQGLECLVASTADHAIELAKTRLPAGIILDLNLPDHPGLFVLDMLKNYSKTKHIPIHVLSALDEWKTAQALGANGYTGKPIERAAVRDIVASFQASSSKPTILVVSKEEDSAAPSKLSELWARYALEIARVDTVEDACVQLQNGSFVCVVVDVSDGRDGSYAAPGSAMARGLAHPLTRWIVWGAASSHTYEDKYVGNDRPPVIIQSTDSIDRLFDEIELCLTEATSRGPVDDAEDALVQSRDATLHGRTILLVENDVRNIFALTSLFEAKGATIVSARNGIQALSLLEQRSDIELILMDVMMPEMDGMIAMREIRKRGGRFTKLPIIAITAKALADDERRCMNAGASDYCAKPLNVERILSLVRVWISLKSEELESC